MARGQPHSERLRSAPPARVAVQGALEQANPLQGARTQTHARTTCPVLTRAAGRGVMTLAGPDFDRADIARSTAAALSRLGEFDVLAGYLRFLERLLDVPQGRARQRSTKPSLKRPSRLQLAFGRSEVFPPADLSEPPHVAAPDLVFRS